MAFLQKRGHLCAVARGREMFARVADMTPARFDILYLIHEQVVEAATRVRSNIIEQASIPHLLGLRRQTVWEMVERLVELGLVKKTKNVNGPDPRRNILSLTEEGIRSVRQANGVAFTESTPLPSNAPTEGEVPRYWRRPELADTRRDMLGQTIPPKKIGREVAKVYTSFAWNRVTANAPNRRYRYLAFLDDMMMLNKALAVALGDTSAEIYPITEPAFWGPPECAREPRSPLKGKKGQFCEVPLRKLPGPRVTPTAELVGTRRRCRPARPRWQRRRCPRLEDRRCPIASTADAAPTARCPAAA